MGPHVNSSTRTVDLYIIYTLLLLVTQLAEGEARTGPQVFLALKAMLLTHTLHSYLNAMAGHAAPFSTNRTNSTITMNNRGHHLWKACRARIRKLWLRDVKVTQISNMYGSPDLSWVPWTPKGELSVPPADTRAVTRP